MICPFRHVWSVTSSLTRAETIGRAACRPLFILSARTPEMTFRNGVDVDGVLFLTMVRDLHRSSQFRDPLERS